MIVRVLTTCRTQHTRDRNICFFYLIERNSKVLFHTLYIQKLKVRIRTAIETITADMLQRVWKELDYRVDVCRITKGLYIEHL